MTEKTDFETYLSVTNDNFQIFLFDKKKFKNLYKNELKIENQSESIDLHNLSKFLDDNIFKIEKLAGTFIKNIFLIIESNKIFYVDVGIKKKKNHQNMINQKYLENTLIELKDLFKENHQEQNIMHIIINNFLIDEKNYSSFVNNLNGDYLCLEVNFKCISNNLMNEFDKILEKYQIKITQYLDGSYVKSFQNENDIQLSEMSHKLRNGLNFNEVLLVPKNIENKGFFEKFFQLFS